MRELPEVGGRGAGEGVAVGAFVIHERVARILRMGRRLLAVVVGRQLRDEGLEYAADRPDEVEVDDGAPGDAFCVECVRGVQELEFCVLCALD